MTIYLDLIQKHPHIDDRRQLPRIKREWRGRRVAVRYIIRRGSYTSRTQTGWAWGELVAAEQDIHVAVRTSTGVRLIHYRRVTDVFDLTRTTTTRKGSS